MKYAYLFETRGIQRFLFATGKLKDMLEGSELIDYICATNGLLDETLKGLNLAKKVSSPRRAGGAFYLVFTEKSEAQRFQSAWRIVMSQWLPSLEQVDVISEDKTAKGAIKKGIEELAKQRNKINIQLPNASPITERSPRTGQAVVKRRPYGASGTESLDASTYILRKFKRPTESLSIEQRFLDTNTLDKNIGQIHFPNNFEEDAKGDKKFPLGRRNLVGLIHADGNGLGEILRVLNKACENASDDVYIDLYRTFSEGMTTATIEATNRATKETLLQHRNDKNVLPVRPLVLGGDDLSLIIRADLAIEFTQAFLTAFKETSKTELAKLKEKFISNGLEKHANELPSYLTACAGIVFMKSSQPFYQAYELAESLCKQAKTHSRNHKQDDSENADVKIIPSSLAFYKINDSLLEDLEMMITNSLSVVDGDKHYKLAMPAYMLKNIENTVYLDNLLALSELLNSKTGINNRPLREVATLMHLNLEQAKATYQRWLDYSKRSQENISSAEKHEINGIKIFLEKLANLIGTLEPNLPMTKISETEYQSVLADLLTLGTIAEEQITTTDSE